MLEVSSRNMRSITEGAIFEQNVSKFLEHDNHKNNEVELSNS